MGDLAIGEVARRAGIRASAIRFYERQGLLQEPPRRSGRRCYDSRTVRQLRLIRDLRSIGKSVAEIRTWVEASRTSEGAEELRHLARAEISSIEQKLEALKLIEADLVAKLECRCSSLSSCKII